MKKTSRAIREIVLGYHGLILPSRRRYSSSSG
jgi:hypothetical protein